MQKISGKDGKGPAFSGLWLCPDVQAEKQAFFRSAILFLEGPRMNYKLRFNHDAVEEGMTMEFVWDYRVTPTIIHEHPLGYPATTQIEIPWRMCEDGAFMLQFRDGWERYYPATFDDLFKVGFERDFVEETLAEVDDEGWKYRLEPGFPSFAKATTQS